MNEFEIGCLGLSSHRLEQGWETRQKFRANLIAATSGQYCSFDPNDWSARHSKWLNLEGQRSVFVGIPSGGTVSCLIAKLVAEERSEHESKEHFSSAVQEHVFTVISEAHHQEVLERQRLVSQLIALRRARLAARKTADRLAKENNGLRDVNKTLQRTLQIQENGETCLRESYRGVVSETLGDQVEVTYETPDGPLKQIYQREQFVGGKLPKEGASIETHVIAAVVDRQNAGTKETEFVSDLPTFRDKTVSGPIRL